MNEATTRVIEVNGIKMEVDLRYARKVEEFKIGSRVKVLLKDAYGGPRVEPGVIVGFEDFQSLPTIVVCYLQVTYADAQIHFAHINEKTAEKYEVILAQDDDLPVARFDVEKKLETEIEKKRQEIAEIERKRDYFREHFAVYFADRLAQQA